MRTISSTATTISFRSGLWLLDGTGRRRPWFLPDSRIGHRRPGFGGFEMPVLQQFDRNAVGRADEGHMPVARRAVDGHASVHQSLAGGVDIVHAIGEVVEIEAAGIGYGRERKRVEEGKRVSVGVDLGGRRIINKKNKNKR